MRFVFATVACLALISIGASPAFARYVDPGKKYLIEFPAGWSKPVPVADSVQSDAPGGSKVAFCRANSVRMPTLDAYTQQKINTSFAKPLDDATWAGVMKLEPSKLTILNRDARIVDGHVVQFVTLRLTADVLGQDLTVRYASHILVGRMVNALCFAPPKSFDSLKTTFENVITSLKPL